VLKEIGGHRFQGYLFAKPMPGPEMTEKLASAKQRAVPAQNALPIGA